MSEEGKQHSNTRKLLAMGAEAWIFREGDKCIKLRVKKGYRHEKLDKRIRSERTKKEFRIMRKIHSLGVKIPKPIEMKDFEIAMEFIEGKKLSEFERLPREIYDQIARIIAEIHNLGIYHGDISPYNFIYGKDGIYLIDFGLADYGNIEDFAVDLKVLRDTFKVVFKDFDFERFLKSYRKYSKNADAIITRLKEVDARGRYK